METGKLRAMCKAGEIRWSEHAARRMLERGILRQDVLAAVDNGEIIEHYPDAWPNPACLIHGTDSNGEALHVVTGLADVVVVITVYHPSIQTFMPDLKTRRDQ